MTRAGSHSTPIIAADGAALAVKLRRAERRNELKAFGLMLPLLTFMLVFFLLPIGTTLLRSVENDEVATILPRAVEVMRKWDGHGVPDEDAFAALAADLREAARNRTAQSLGIRLNIELADYRTLIARTARSIGQVEGAPYKDALIRIDARWNEARFWAVIWRNTSHYTGYFYLTALDLERNTNQEIQLKPADQRIYLPILFRTFWISLLVTGLCLTIGYPVAFLLARQPPERANILMFFVLVPFWTSLLVRTIGWIVLLQEHGVVNDFLLSLGVTTQRHQLIYNRTGLLIAMVHVLLPFMILPLYSVMKGINPSYMRAARSLGANSVVAFLTVYLPQSWSGIVAGSFLVFILAIGYYITPELVGGPGDQMISHFIAYYTDFLINWGQASALAVMLLVSVLVFVAVSFRFLRLGEN